MKKCSVTKNGVNSISIIVKRKLQMNLGHPHTLGSPVVSNKQASEHTQPQHVINGLSALDRLII